MATLELMPLRSRSRPWLDYEMVLLPEGIAVHGGEGCEGEQFNGPMGCWHSKEYSIMTTALTRTTEGVLTPAPVEFSPEQLDVIKTTICKGATDAELQLFVATCRRTGLDPFLHQIHAVKRYDSKEKREVMAIQVGIDGLQLVAERTGKYAGMDPILYLNAAGEWVDVWTEDGHPRAAKVSVYRKDFDRPVPATCRWDSYAQVYNRDSKTYLMPNWEKMPDVMLGKCALSLALRRAFPADMSGFALAADPDFDFDAEAQEQREAAVDQAQAQLERPDAIEGEVVRQAPQPRAAAAPAEVQPSPVTPARSTKTEDVMKAWWGNIDQLGINRDMAVAKSNSMFDNRDPRDLKPQERATLLVELRKALRPEPEPEAVTVHEHTPAYTRTGAYVCSDCGEILEEPTEEEEGPE